MSEEKQPPGHWREGDAEIEGFLDMGELELVEPSADHAARLIEQAENDLAAGEPLIPVYPSSALTLIYDGARKAMTAALAQQGLRPTHRGGHRVIQDAVEAQLGKANSVVRGFRDLRRRRNESEYPSVGTPDVTEEEVRQGLTDAQEILASMKKFVRLVGPFR